MLTNQPTIQQLHSLTNPQPQLRYRNKPWLVIWQYLWHFLPCCEPGGLQGGQLMMVWHAQTHTQPISRSHIRQLLLHRTDLTWLVSSWKATSSGFWSESCGTLTFHHPITSWRIKFLICVYCTKKTQVEINICLVVRQRWMNEVSLLEFELFLSSGWELYITIQRKSIYKMAALQ